MTSWARETFGDLAGPLADAIPQCLKRAHDRARDAHESVRTQTLEAYGHGLYAAQYEELEAGLEHLPGAAPVRLQSRKVMTVADSVIYPIRYAKRDLPVTVARLRKAHGLRADLIRLHGPEPRQMGLDLGIEEPEQEPHPDLHQLGPGIVLILVPYACSLSRGLIRIEWGRAELQSADRYLIWHEHEVLPLPA